MRVGIKQLTSIVKAGGDYELIEGSNKTTTVTINIVDISMGGLCMESKNNLKAGVSFDLEIPKVQSLYAATIQCEVTRSVFREDPLYYKNLGTDRDASYFEIGLKFKTPNTEYLKQLYKLAVSNQI